MGFIGTPGPRPEDVRLTTGQGQFVSDFARPGMVHLTLVRSTHAHARLLGVEQEAARRLPGVVGVFTAQDLGAVNKPLPGLVPDPRLDPALPPPLAADVVRFVGQPVAAVVAESRYVAEDAAELVRVHYEPLPAVLDPEEALVSGRLVHEARGTNRAAVVQHRVGRGEDALSEAETVVRVTLRLSRVVAHPLEPRGVAAYVDAATGRLEVVAASQGVFGLRSGLAVALGRPEESIRVVAPDIGGGFGVKNRIYPEDVLVAYLAERLGRPVRWLGDRREEFLGTNQERDQVHHAAIGVDCEGRIVAVVDHLLHDTGAYTVAGLLVPNTTCICIPGPYRVPNFEARADVVFTNKVPVGPYRGAGRPQATFVMERLLDRAADAIGLDRVEIRRRNLVRPDEIPYESGVQGRDGRPMTYTEGDFPACMDLALDLLGYEAWRERQEAWRAAGRLVGVGVANALEMSATIGFEGVRMGLQSDGRVRVATGSSSQGQGHAAMLRAVAADRLGLPVEEIDVVEGDTDSVGRGVGTFGSRTTVLAGNAVAKVAPLFRRRLLEAAAKVLEAHPDDLLWEGGRVHVAGVPERGVTLREVARQAAARGDLPEAEDVYESGPGTFGMGTQAVVVEVDPETFRISLLSYAISHDGGVVVNPLSVAGQMIGGAVQGIGTALYERLFLDASGQPLNTSFMDYLLPTAAEMPDFLLAEQTIPARTNPEGFKGVGEGGIMPAAAAVLSAIEDALSPFGVILDAVPVSSALLHRLVRRSAGA